jgi:hypothetical protein
MAGERLCKGGYPKGAADTTRLKGTGTASIPQLEC